MGLDVLFGLVILVFILRGMFQGFLAPMLKLLGLAGCFFAAAPVRDLVMPGLQPYFAAIDPVNFSKMVWWGSAFSTYVLWAFLVGISVRFLKSGWFATLGLNSTDVFAGIGLGALKGGVAASLLATVVVHYESYLDGSPGIWDQIQTSRGLALVRTYHPVESTWSWAPVVGFRQHVWSQGGFEFPAVIPGQSSVAGAPAAKTEVGSEPVKTASAAASSDADADVTESPAPSPSVTERVGKMASDWVNDQAVKTASGLTKSAAEGVAGAVTEAVGGEASETETPKVKPRTISDPTKPRARKPRRDILEEIDADGVLGKKPKTDTPASPAPTEPDLSAPPATNAPPAEEVPPR